MIYMINEWHGALNDDTAPIYRTNNKADFERMKKKVLQERTIIKRTGRTTVTKTHTIFAYACNYDGYYAFIRSKHTLKPVSVEWEKNL